MSSRSATGYHLQTTGQAAETAAAHAPAQDIAASIHFLGACFCPFVHRSWIALEILNQLIADPSKRKVSKIDYVYDECDPYKKEQRLVEISPKGLVPGRSLNDSIIINHYLASLPLADGIANPLLPSAPYERARHLQAGQKHSETITPAFYKYLQAQEKDKQLEYGKSFAEALTHFENEMHPQGPFFFGQEMGWVDILIAPWAVRLRPVLTHYRAFEPDLLTDKSRRFHQWLEAVQAHPAVKATTSTDQLYTDSYSRYSQNLPFTSQVADAINSGKALP